MSTHVRDWQATAVLYEYISAVNPNVPKVPVIAYPSKLHREGPTQVIPLDISKELDCAGPATGPTVSAHYIHIKSGENLATEASATAQVFYCIRGAGRSITAFGDLSWSEGDVFGLPATGSITHFADQDVALYWVSDAPLLRYLGVKPSGPRFKPALYPRDRILQKLREIDNEPGARQRNRDAAILGNNEVTVVKSMTHTLWTAVVLVTPGEVAQPHRHNSIAIDIVIGAQPGVYTLLGYSIDENGEIVNPQRVDWESGAAFITPPGIWHGHSNESGQPAVVMAVQDAGLHE